MKHNHLLVLILGFITLGAFWATFANIVKASGVASPPMHIRTWEWNASSSLGLVTTTAKNVTLTQNSFTDQPGTFPTQGMLIFNDGAAGAPDIFFVASVDATANATNSSTSNNVTSIRVVAGGPPLSVTGRFNYFSIIRGTNGTNVDTSARLDAVY